VIDDFGNIPNYLVARELVVDQVVELV
jgi:hypothetical protein